jgi:hypothetical protein
MRYLILATLLLSSCTTNEAPAHMASQAAATAQPAQNLAGCKKAIAAFKNVIGSDLDTGDTTKEVHARMVSDLSGSEQACSAGNEGAALGQLAGVKSKYGYPNQ